MKRYVCLFMLLLIVPSLRAQDQLEKGLERINFFPDADAYFISRYEHERVEVETPEATIDTKEVNNYANRLSLGYGHRFARKWYAGINAYFEEASENAVTYGIPLRRRFNSVGFKEPEIFCIYRLRTQKGERGLMDLFVSLTPTLGKREIGNENANRLNGENILKVSLSHGLWEEEWEFKTALNIVYYDEGEEHNSFDHTSYRSSSHYTINPQFSAQYRIDPWLFVFGSVGIIYHSTETIKESASDKREILSGTGSLFRTGLKRPLGKWSLLELSYTLNRNEYFVKSELENLEGDFVRQTAGLTYIMAF